MDKFNNIEKIISLLDLNNIKIGEAVDRQISFIAPMIEKGYKKIFIHIKIKPSPQHKDITAVFASATFNETVINSGNSAVWSQTEHCKTLHYGLDFTKESAEIISLCGYKEEERLNKYKLAIYGKVVCAINIWIWEAIKGTKYFEIAMPRQEFFDKKEFLNEIIYRYICNTAFFGIGISDDALLFEKYFSNIAIANATLKKTLEKQVNEIFTKIESIPVVLV